MLNAFFTRFWGLTPSSTRHMQRTKRITLLSWSTKKTCLQKFRRTLTFMLSEPRAWLSQENSLTRIAQRMNMELTNSRTRRISKLDFASYITSKMQQKDTSRSSLICLTNFMKTYLTLQASALTVNCSSSGCARSLRKKISGSSLNTLRTSSARRSSWIPH